MIIIFSLEYHILTVCRYVVEKIVGHKIVKVGNETYRGLLGLKLMFLGHNSI